MGIVSINSIHLPVLTIKLGSVNIFYVSTKVIWFPKKERKKCLHSLLLMCVWFLKMLTLSHVNAHLQNCIKLVGKLIFWLDMNAVKGGYRI